MELHITPDENTTILNLEEVSWDEVRGSVKSSYPDLFRAIEALDPGKKLTFIKARYPYGSTIVDNGQVHLPLKSGKTIPCNSPVAVKTIKNKLSYSPIPLALLLNKAAEAFISVGDSVAPLRLMMPGNIFGASEIADVLSDIPAEPISSIVSGARSIFMLPKIQNKEGYKRFNKELNMPVMPPRSLEDQWEVFRQLSNHHSYVNDWHNDMLYFTNAWFENDKDLKWVNFYNFLFKESNKVMKPLRDEKFFNQTWRVFSSAIEKRNLKPRNYLMDTTKHLMAVALGIQPGFRPSNRSGVVAPTDVIQTLFTEIYGLQKHLPTLMHLYNMHEDGNFYPTYYSLSHPFIAEGGPTHRVYPDIIADLRMLKMLTDTLFQAIENNSIPLLKIHEMLRKVKFDYFHCVKDASNDIGDVEDIIRDDPVLIKDRVVFKGRDFSRASPFLSGCIRTTLR